MEENSKFSNQLGLIDMEYLGDDVSVGYTDFENALSEVCKIALVKDSSDGDGYAIAMNRKILNNFLRYIIDREHLKIVPE